MMLRPVDALRLVPFVFSRQTRARILGARVEMCGYLLARAPSPAILLVRSVYGDWMVPQEGVGLDEGLDDAFWRCLSEELGVEVEDSDRARLCNHRGEEFLGKLKLPAGRSDIGRRPVAPGLREDHPLYRVKMRKKAYWAIYQQIAHRGDIVPTPNGREVDDAVWLSLREATDRITASTRPAKAALLLRGIHACESILAGTARHIEPPSSADDPLP